MMYHYASEKYVCFPRYIVLVFWVQHLSITISTQQSILKTKYPLCSRNFQNVKLRLHGVGVLRFYCHSNFTWNQILLNWNGQKCDFWQFQGVLILILVNLSNFSILLPLKFYVKSSFVELKRSKMWLLAILGGLNFDFGKFEQFFNAEND